MPSRPDAPTPEESNPEQISPLRAETSSVPQPPPKSLISKLATIMGEVGNIEKGGTNETQKYKFVRESDVVAKLVPLLAKHHVYLHTSVVFYSHEKLYETRSGNTMWMDTVALQGTWMDGDTGESLPAAVYYGTGADTGDKAVYKAQTGAEKYLLLKSLLISTGDDPEADEKVDKATAAQGAARGSRVASTHQPTRSAQPGTTRGGKSTASSTPQLDELGRLARLAQFDVAKLGAFIGRTLNDPAINEATEGAVLKDYLEALAAEQMGALIVALTTIAEPEESDDADPFAGGETAEPDAGGYGG